MPGTNLISKAISRTSYSENYYRVMLTLFGLAYLFTWFYRSPDAVPLKEFLLPRHFFGAIPLTLAALTYLVPTVRDHIKDLASGFFLVCTLHLIGFFAINDFLSYYETGLITVVLISNLHLNKVLYIVLYNVIVLTAMEYVFITADENSNVQPVIFFFFLLAVMILCIYYQLYRIRHLEALSGQDKITEGLITGNPDAWIIFEGPGLVAVEAGNKAFRMFGIQDKTALAQLSLHAIIAGNTRGEAEQLIRNVLTDAVTDFRCLCRKQDGQIFMADVASFRIPGIQNYIQCRFVDVSRTDDVPDELIRYRRYLDLTESGLIVCDENGFLRLINRKAIQLMDLDLEESWAGKDLGAVFPAHAAAQLLSYLSQPHSERAGKESSVEIVLQENKLKLVGTNVYDYLENKHELVISLSKTEPVVQAKDAARNRFSDEARETIIDAVPVSLPYAKLESSGKIIEVNQGFCSLVGYNSKELLAVNAARLVAPTDAEKWKSLCEHPGSEEVQLKKISGESIAVRVNTRISGNGNGILLIDAFFTDVSIIRNSELSLSEANASLKAVIENSDEVIFSVDFNHRVTEMNTAFISESGKKQPGTIPHIGDDYRSFMDVTEKKSWEQTYDEVMKGKRLRKDNKVVYPDGSEAYFEISYNPITNPIGLVTGISVLARNVTERIRFEEALVKARDEADSATQAKSGFLATMSHEIRTPLNGLLGMAELLKSTKLDASQKDFLKSIQLSGEALLSVINDILDFSRIESGKLELELKPFQLESCIRETFEITGYRAKEKDLALRYSIDPALPQYVFGDKSRLRQILVNLVGNAIKFTDKGTVTVRVNNQPGSGVQGMVLFSIADTGIGMNPQQLTRLFEPFVQADSDTFSKYGGTGLGLAICKKLTELMHGTIWAESKQGSGSTFFFTSYLPATADSGKLFTEQAAQTRPAPELHHAVVPLRILVAEDNVVNQQLILLFLKKLGYSPDLATNGIESTEMANVNPYDIILMDIRMPDIDGFEASRIILSKPGPKPIIIALTAMAMQGDKEKCLAAGMKDYLTKPIRLDDLASMLHKWGKQSIPETRVPKRKVDTKKTTVIDDTVINNLRELGGSDTGFLRQLISLYLEQSEETIGEIQNALASNNRELAGQSAHKLKGSSLNLGVVLVAESCRKIEEDAEIADMKALKSEADILGQRFSEAAAVLKQVIGIT